MLLGHVETYSDCTVLPYCINFEMLNGHFKLLQNTVLRSSSPYPTPSVSTFEFFCQGEITVILGNM